MTYAILFTLRIYSVVSCTRSPCFSGCSLRSSVPPCLQARRDREGAPGRVQRAAPGARRRAPDGQQGPHGGLLKRHDRPHVERGVPQRCADRLRRCIFPLGKGIVRCEIGFFVAKMFFIQCMSTLCKSYQLLQQRERFIENVFYLVFSFIFTFVMN